MAEHSNDRREHEEQEQTIEAQRRELPRSMLSAAAGVSAVALQRRLMRRRAAGNGVQEWAEEAVGRASASSGTSLPRDLQRTFETSLGADLSGVRVHTGAASAEAAASVSARAYTLGQDIHFNEGQYRPNAPDGQHLIAHEVAHTVQQAGGAAADMQAKQEVSTPGDAQEVEADSAADAMVRGEVASVSPRRASITLQRKPTADNNAKLEEATSKANAEKNSEQRRKKWKSVAEYLGDSSIWSESDIDTIVSRLSHNEKWNLYYGSTEASSGIIMKSIRKSDLVAADNAEKTFNYEQAVRMNEWKMAADALNVFNINDIKEKLSSLSNENLLALKVGAEKCGITGIVNAINERCGFEMEVGDTPYSWLDRWAQAAKDSIHELQGRYLAAINSFHTFMTFESTDDANDKIPQKIADAVFKKTLKTMSKLLTGGGNKKEALDFVIDLADDINKEIKQVKAAVEAVSLRDFIVNSNENIYNETVDGIKGAIDDARQKAKVKFDGLNGKVLKSKVLDEKGHFLRVLSGIQTETKREMPTVKNLERSLFEEWSSYPDGNNQPSDRIDVEQQVIWPKKTNLQNGNVELEKPRLEYVGAKVVGIRASKVADGLNHSHFDRGGKVSDLKIVKHLRIYGPSYYVMDITPIEWKWQVIEFDELSNKQREIPSRSEADKTLRKVEAMKSFIALLNEVSKVSG